MHMHPTLLQAVRSAHLLRLLRGFLGLLFFTLALGTAGHAQTTQTVTPQLQYWVDANGQADVDKVAALPVSSFQSMKNVSAFNLERGGALWLRWEVPALDPERKWHLLLEGPSYTNRVSLYQRGSSGAWRVEQAGDQLPMSQWTHPDLAPTFEVDAKAAGAVWIRLDNFPSALNAGFTLVDGASLLMRRNLVLLSVGMYVGFGLLVLFLGWVHVRLYEDRAFFGYVAYVACMLGFQISSTGVGALFLWPEWPRWNDIAPAVFVLWLSASGIWFVREVAALYRHNRRLNRLVMYWSVAGYGYAFIHVLLMNSLSFKLLNLYGLLSVLLSLGACIWAWRKGEIYAGWTALGFLPLHLAYPFAALRSVGVLGDSWLTQYAVMVGSAIEIPLLLYILHRRARDFGENRARMRALDSTDPLTGLPILIVLLLRMRDTLRRARRGNTNCGVALVELANYEQIAIEHSREMADRALVVTASQLVKVARDIDTVCRVTATRFFVLFENPHRPEALRLFAQHIVARGLGELPTLPTYVKLQLRVVTIALPDWTQSRAPAEELEVQQLIERTQRALDKLDPARVVLHLPLVWAKPPAT